MTGTRTAILVVDDEEIVRESLGGWLEKDGYEVECAADGPAAVARLRARPWSILVCDLRCRAWTAWPCWSRPRSSSPTWRWSS
jgi:CheY-like chemotaxis protein